MFPIIAKISAILFCAYVSFDSFRQAKQIRLDVEDDQINPKTGKVLRHRAIRNGVIFCFGALLAIASLFFRIAPLGE